MKYDLIALDLDGTLLGPNHTVSLENRRAIADAQEAGVLVVPCTGRGWRESLNALGDVPGLPVGVFNTGAVVVEMDSGHAVDLADIEPHLTLELIEFMRDLPQAVLVFQEHGRTGRDFLVTGDGEITDNTQRWFKMNNLLVAENRHPTPEDLHHSLRVGVVATGRAAFDVEEQLVERFANRVDLHCFAGVPTAKAEDAVFIVEVFAKGVNKWRGLSWIADQRGISADRIATIGDEINDLAMLEHAGLGVAMANAVPRAAEKADRHTLSHAEDGVAHAIRKMLDGAW
ncbi:MAG: Cof-type HAD-IIB family hydrolase [Planctomycetota bacterium]